MKAGKTIRKYYKKCARNIKVVLDKQDEKLSEEDFHKLRVEIKKIKAIAKLVKFCDRNFKRKKCTYRYQLLFQQAGKVRELQLEANTLHQKNILHSLNGYAASLQKNITAEKRSFLLLAQKKKTSKLLKKNKNFTVSAHYIKQKKINRFFEKQQQKIDKLMNSKKLKPDEAHQLRKRLKELLYITRIFNPKSGQPKSLKELENLLGNWHDKVVLEGYFENTIQSGTLSAKEIKSVQSVEHKTARENRNLFNKIKQNITSFQQHNVQ